jgi:predicted AAA+ superfamily ATPase
VITGQLVNAGSSRRYRLSGINVETAVQESAARLSVHDDRALRNLINAVRNAPVVVSAANYGDSGTVQPKTAGAFLDRGILFAARGDFPEPFLAEDEAWALRWRNQYVDGLIREDVLDFERLSDFKSLALTLELLRKRTGSPVSYSSIARDLGVSPGTVKKYVQIFEALNIVFRLSPFSDNIARSLLKEPKIYFYDTGMVLGDDGAKFENLAALSLAKEAAAAEDIRGIRATLHYIRTKDGREVDFCYAENGAIRFFAEVKLSDADISKNLAYFCEKYNKPGIQIVKNLKHERRQGGIEVRRAVSFF